MRELTSCRLTTLSLVEVSSCLSMPSVMLPHLEQEWKQEQEQEQEQEHDEEQE